LLADTEEGKPVKLVALVLRGDHELNAIKAEKLVGVKAPLTMASESQIEEVVGCKPGSIGPVGLAIETIVDRSAAQLADFICGANKEGFHLAGVNWERDASLSARGRYPQCSGRRCQS
jgi:prolyl-tRNA synthetase